MSRLSIEISPKQHQYIKALAAMEGQSIKEFVMSRLFSTDAKGDASYEEFKSFLHGRIDQVSKGELSQRTAREITDNILGNQD